jgi:hypothetical protein
VLVAHFVRFADHLPAPERCSTARVLLTARQSASSACVDPPCARGRALLAAARARRALLAHELAQDLLGQASQLAESTGGAALRGEVRLEQGLLWLQKNGQTERGLRAIKEALWLAQRARDDELAAICWERLLAALSASARPDHIEETRRLLPHAQAALTRIGGDAELSARLASIAESLPRTPQ